MKNPMEVFDILQPKHLPLLSNFSCQEDSEFLKLLGFNKHSRKKIKSHNTNIEHFFMNESLTDQKHSLSTTHVLLSDNQSELIGFISLCNDCIPLETEEKEYYGFPYTTIPALKIARLAVDTKHQHRGYSKKLLQYAIYQAIKIRESSGLVFLTVDCYSHRLSFYLDKCGFTINQVQTVSSTGDVPISLRLHVDDYLEKIS